MGTITVRLDAADELLLDQLAAVHGDRSTAVREAIRLLSGRDQRARDLRELMAEIEEEGGPFDEAEIEAMARRYGL